MIEIIFEIIIVLIFQYPGALLRWLFLHKKRTFKSLLKDDPYINSLFSIAFLGLIFIIIKHLF